MAAPVIDILMYHSIADAPGPTSIAPEIFAAQMQAIAEADIPVISLDDMLAARNGQRELAPYSIIITFDDGFRDFLQNAQPVLAHHGFGAMVYLPSGQVGRDESWVGAHEPPRQLMSWHEIRRLSTDGVAFGSHTVTHPDLTELSDEVLEAELARSRDDIQAHVGMPVRHFAPPYGLAGMREQRVIAQIYKTSVGTRLGWATLGGQLYDLPRLEMFYFRDIERWKTHLRGGGGGYLRARKLMRTVRETLLQPWQ